MGYEVVYYYHPRNDDGKWSEEKAELKVEIGGPFEDVAKEKLVSAIMSQMARRDILIFDAEVWELRKTKISFKETKGGIVLGNRKYTFDGINISFQEVKEVSLAPPPALPAVQQNLPALPSVSNGKPIKWVTLDPDEPNLMKIKASGLAFLPDKRYPVLMEKAHPKKLGVMIYTVVDENKREVPVTDEYFLNADQVLQKGFRNNVDKGAQLSYGDREDMPMPDVRRR